MSELGGLEEGGWSGQLNYLEIMMIWALKHALQQGGGKRVLKWLLTEA